ncbi:MAG: hypothetical protein JSU77_07200 [Fidelibacterota bacterium]|nr:MAG: hypothetical protein JSU77_07200 [Candidatus Neomarinimicrobiota bacterium]
MSVAPLSREEVFQRSPWLQDRDRPMVISADVDGLLSAAFLHHHLGWQVTGYYDNATLWLSTMTDQQRNRLVWVDLDICWPDCPALGHHILTLTGGTPTSLSCLCNPNLLAGIGADAFTSKYPFSTIVFLLWLHNVPLRRDLLARLLVLHADSSWINYQHYGDNCRSWRQRLPGYDWRWLFYQVDSERFEERMRDQLHAQLEHLGVYNSQDCTSSHHFGLKGGQLRFNPDWDEDVILNVYSLAGTYLKWSPPEASVITDRIEGRRTTASLKSLASKDFPENLIRRGIFSYAITNRNTINFTRLDWQA